MLSSSGLVLLDPANGKTRLDYEWKIAQYRAVQPHVVGSDTILLPTGMNMGTRFIATKEAPVHPNVKKALVEASELDTVLVMRALRNTERVLKNKGVDHLLEIEGIAIKRK